MEDKEPHKESKRYQNSDYPSGSLEAALKTDRKPQLRLEREPSQRALPREEFDEMVPEFMHRGFFRSEEGPALEPSGRLGSKRPDWESDTLEYSREKILKETAPKEPLISLRASAPQQRQTDELPPEPPCTEPEPEEVERELKPLVSSRPRAESVQPKSEPSAEKSEEEPQPLRTPPPPVPEPELEPEPSGGGPPTPPPEKETSSSKVSGPLVLLLLVVVALFVWRERTRPGQVAQQQPLPVPTVKVVEVPAVQPPTAPAEESPYPAMSPIATTTQPEVSEEPDTADVEPEAGTADDMAAQRAAILNGVPDPDDTGAPEPTLEEPPAPVEQPSVTPAPPTEETVARTAPPPDPVQSHTIPEPWRTDEEPADGSLFPATEEPTEAVEPEVSAPPQEPVATQPSPAPPVAETPPPAIPKLPTVEGDPYKIAEPEL